MVSHYRLSLAKFLPGVIVAKLNLPLTSVKTSEYHDKIALVPHTISKVLYHIYIFMYSQH